MEQGENQIVTPMAFHEGPPPVDYQWWYASYLFNTQKHRQLQSKTGWKEFHWLDDGSKNIVASAFFHVFDQLAKSPYRAPFGGFEATENLPPETLDRFISRVEEALRRDQIQTIEILNPPELYSSSQALLTTLLLNHGYAIALAEPSACIQVDATALPGKMAKDKRARYRQCLKAGLTFKQLDIKKLEEVYTFIAQCRDQQERKLSMTLPELTKTVKALPKAFFLVGVFDKKKMIGACICVRVSVDIVYTFYSAHDPEYDSISPRVFLLSNLYGWCAKNKIRLLDLGTSALDGKPNFPLLDFKLRIGATFTHKFKFRKTLA